MSKTKKILIALLLVIIVMQFIQPVRNRNTQVPEADLLQHRYVPGNVAGILKTSCYDCHSNNTDYPWYASIQPFGWTLAKHIQDGKAELNFNEFKNYSQRRQLSKLKAIQNSIKDGSMPLSSYALLHPDAKLSKERKALVIKWATKLVDSLSTDRQNNE